jgi:hypothetical protein
LTLAAGVEDFQAIGPFEMESADFGWIAGLEGLDEEVVALRGAFGALIAAGFFSVLAGVTGAAGAVEGVDGVAGASGVAGFSSAKETNPLPVRLGFQ